MAVPMSSERLIEIRMLALTLHRSKASSAHTQAKILDEAIEEIDRLRTIVYTTDQNIRHFVETYISDHKSADR